MRRCRGSKTNMKKKMQEMMMLVTPVLVGLEVS
jgi:hypothetical protein